MMKFIHLTHTLLLLLCLTLALPQAASAAKSPNKQQLYRMLVDNKHEAVRNLSESERDLLLGMLALDAGKTTEAITTLNRPAVSGDPLAALIRAEAYRRQSVKAATRAGTYAHAVNSDISKLKNARLTTGLSRAEQRLQAFVDTLNHPEKNSVKEPTIVATVKTNSLALMDELRSDIEQWRKDWQSLNADAYLAHYHPDFKTPKHDLASWQQYKRRVNGRKSYIQVDISRLKIIGTVKQIQQGEALLVEFRQTYRSSNFTASGRKRLYLVRSDQSQNWKILYEGEPGQPMPTFNKTHVSVNNSSALHPATQKVLNNWAINIGSFDSRTNAEEMANGINVPPGEKQPFISSITSNGKLIHRVRIGMFASRSDAVNTMLEACPALGLTDCWLEQLD